MSKVQNQDSDKDQSGNISKPLLSDSAEHNKWLETFSKKKEGRLFNLRYEFEIIQSTGQFKNSNVDIKSYSANAMWIMAQGTRFEEDVKYLIEQLSPEFFKG